MQWRRPKPATGSPPAGTKDWPRTLGGIALLLVAILLGAWFAVRWALDAPAAARFAVERAVAGVPGLSVDGVDGTLAQGLAARRIVWETDDLRVTVVEPNVRWTRSTVIELARRALVGAAGPPMLRLETLAATRVEVVAKRASAEPPSLPTSLRLPVHLEVAELAVGELDYSNPSTALKVRQIAARVSSDGAAHRVSLTRVVHASGTLAGELVLGADSPFALAGSARLQGQAGELGLALDARVDGSLEFPKIAGRLAAKREGVAGDGDVDVELSPFARLPVRRLQVSVRGVDLSAWNAELPTTRLDLDADATMTAEQALAGRIEATNAAAGTLDAGRAPLRALAGRFALAPGRFILEAARATAVRGSLLQGEVRVIDGRGDVRVVTEGLDTSEIDRRMKPLRLAGRVSLKIEPDLMLITGELRHRGYALTADATLRGTRIEVTQAALASPFGKAVLAGDIDLAGSRPFSASGQLKGFNPADFGDFPPARLSGRFSAKGVLEPAPTAEASVELADSTLRGEPIAGTVSAQLSERRRFLGSLDLRYAGAHLLASGALGEPGDRLQWKLEATSLARLDRRLRGQASASGVLRGTFAEPTVEFTASARNAAVGDIGAAAGDLQADGVVELRTGGAFELKATGRELVVDGRRIGQASAETMGTLDAHRVRADAVVDGARIALRGRGAWHPPSRWSGALEEFESEKPAIRLAGAAPLAFDGKSIAFGPAAMAVEGSQLDLRGLSLIDGALSVSGSFRDLAVHRVMKALGRDPGPAGGLVVGGSAELEVGRDLRGRVEIVRQSGDLALSDDGDLAAGLRQLSLAAVAEGGGHFVVTLRAQGDRIGTLDGVARSRFRGGGAAGWSIGSDAPLEATLKGDFRDIAWLGALMPAELRLAGSAKIEATGSGTLGTPRLAGVVSGEGLALRSREIGLELTGGTLRGRFVDSQLTIDRLEAKGPAGTLVASGRIGQVSGRPSGRLDLEADKLRVVSRPDRLVALSGSAAIVIDGTKVGVSGRFRADEGKIELPPTEKPTLASDVVVVTRDAAPSPREAKAPAGGGLASLNVEFDLGDKFVLRGRGLDTRLAGLVRINQANGQITAIGTIRTVDGTYLAYGRKLSIERGLVTFSGPLDNPALDIRALRTRQEVEAGVLVTGALATPNVQLISRPEVPDSEKLSWLVLGQGLDRSNRAQAGLLQSAALTLLSPAGGAGLQAQIAQIFGFDQFSIGTGGDLQTGVVTIGKQLTRDLYVSLEQGLAGANSFVKVNFLFTKNWTVTARSGGQENAVDVYYTLKFDTLGRR